MLIVTAILDVCLRTVTIFGMIPTINVEDNIMKNVSIPVWKQLKIITITYHGMLSTIYVIRVANFELIYDIYSLVYKLIF